MAYYDAEFTCVEDDYKYVISIDTQLSIMIINKVTDAVYNASYTCEHFNFHEHNVMTSLGMVFDALYDALNHKKTNTRLFKFITETGATLNIETYDITAWKQIIGITDAITLRVPRISEQPVSNPTNPEDIIAQLQKIDERLKVVEENNDLFQKLKVLYAQVFQPSANPKAV